ncbi:hypothetical protein RFI_32843, partial [Reticulomyxa filosa]
LTEYVEFTYQWDWGSLKKSPRWNFDTLHVFRDVTYNINSVLICDIRKVKFDINTDLPEPEIDEVKIEPYGYSFFPIFELDEYVKSGCFQNAIFQGALTTKVLDELIKANDIHQVFLFASCNLYVIQFLKNNAPANRKDKNKLLQIMDKQSIFVRVYDEQRVGIIEPPFHKNVSTEEINMDLIPSFLRNDLLYAEDRLKPTGWIFKNKLEPLEAIFPLGMSKDKTTQLKTLYFLSFFILLTLNGVVSHKHSEVLFSENLIQQTHTLKKYFQFLFNDIYNPKIS